MIETTIIMIVSLILVVIIQREHIRDLRKDIERVRETSDGWKDMASLLQRQASRKSEK